MCNHVHTSLTSTTQSQHFFVMCPTAQPKTAVMISFVVYESTIYIYASATLSLVKEQCPFCCVYNQLSFKHCLMLPYFSHATNLQFSVTCSYFFSILPMEGVGCILSFFTTPYMEYVGGLQSKT